MLQAIPQGKSINIQGLECQIPPEGYVWNMAMKQLEFRGVYSRSDIKEEQYWERIPLPYWYKETMKSWDKYEKKKKDDDDEFYDEQLEEYKKQEWDRRLNGFWFFNNGEAIYLVGSHYLFLQWWLIDIGYPKFRFPDLEYFYFLQYCIEDSNCMGMIEITKRRFGKTFRAGIFLVEYVTRTKMTNAGIQSKTGGDAKKLFAKAVVSPFKRLPRFFRPEYDMSLGVTPKTEMRFQQTNVRGKKAEDNLDKDELGSMIDWQSADLTGYDGQKLHRVVNDEIGKTTEVNVYDRHEVLRYCLLDDEGKIIGKALYTTTVEKLDSDKDGVQEAFRLLWDESDQNKKMENGKTPSGLYRFFMTADRARNFDLYGNSDVGKTITEILADRKSVEHNPRALSARIRKEARTIKEAFRVDGDKCLFNSINLENRRDFLSVWGNELVERGNLVWKDGIRDTTVEWKPNPNGFWERVKEFTLSDKEVNLVERRGNNLYPMNNFRFAAALDPYESDITEDNRRSMAAGLVKLKSASADNPLLNAYVFKYHGRRATAALMHEDMIIQCVYLGCGILVESTRKGGMYDHFRDRGYAAFLNYLPGYKEAGVPATPDNKQSAFYFLEAMVEDNCHKIFFLDLIDDLLKFEMAKTQKYDLSMAALWTEMAAFNKLYSKKAERVEVTKYIREYPVPN